jgi:hypothetical protein
MTKEIKEKIEITLEIYNNIKAMIKSSNTEDFFIGAKMWFAMSPPEMLTVILKKHCHKRTRQFLIIQKEEYIWSINHRLTWPVIMDHLIANKEYIKYRDIIEQEFNAYLNQKLMNEGLGKNIKKIKTKIKWQN